jgi:hypothetical protein
MHFDFFNQRISEQISTGDEIALYADKDDYFESGRYTVARLVADENNDLFAMLVGMGPLSGTITEIFIGKTD